jgi:hypothetical protein
MPLDAEQRSELYIKLAKVSQALHDSNAATRYESLCLQALKQQYGDHQAEQMFTFYKQLPWFEMPHSL